MRDLLRRRLGLGLSGQLGPDWSPALLAGHPGRREGGGERGGGGEGLQVGLVIEPAAGTLYLLLALAGQAGGAEHQAGAAGLFPGPARDAEVELVAPLGVRVPRVFVGRTLWTGELVQSTGGTAGSKQFLVMMTVGRPGWPR